MSTLRVLTSKHAQIEELIFDRDHRAVRNLRHGHYDSVQIHGQEAWDGMPHPQLPGVIVKNAMGFFRNQTRRGNCKGCDALLRANITGSKVAVVEQDVSIKRRKVAWVRPEEAYMVAQENAEFDAEMKRLFGPQ